MGPGGRPQDRIEMFAVLFVRSALLPRVGNVVWLGPPEQVALFEHDIDRHSPDPCRDNGIGDLCIVDFLDRDHELLPPLGALSSLCFRYL